MEFRICLTDNYPHDDRHLSLCSKDYVLAEANFYSALDVIHKIPIFILDTSLGAAKSPSVEDIFLSTVDAIGASRDMRIEYKEAILSESVIRTWEKRFGFPLISIGDSRI